MTYDLSREPNDRVVEVLVRCRDCDVPEFIPLEYDKLYRMVVPSYIANGGDGFDVIAEHRQDHHTGISLLFYLG